MSSNNREHLREDCLVPVRYTQDGRPQTQYARVINYCEGGVCLKTRTPISVGTQLNLSLEGYAPDGSYDRAFEEHVAIVRWSKQIPEPGLPAYEIGVEYLE